MAIEIDSEKLLLIGQGHSGVIPVGLTQNYEELLGDVTLLLQTGIGQSPERLQYLHPMGGWREVPSWEVLMTLVREHIEPPLRRHYSLVSAYIEPEEVIVAIGERKNRRPNIFRSNPVQREISIGFQEYHRRGQETAQLNKRTGVWETQIPNKASIPHLLRIRQLGQ